MHEKLIAVTFDDGPNTVTTPIILDILEKFNVTGTFFVVGNNINDNSAAVMKRAHEMGCEICNHSLTHSVMPEMTAADISAEISETSAKITAVTGCVPSFFRPPYIAVNDVMFDAVPLTFIAGFGCNDWDDSVSAEERFIKTMEQASHGGIILLHDMSGNDNTAAALEKIIPALISEGYRLVTVSDLFRLCGISPAKGIVYSNVFQKN